MRLFYSGMLALVQHKHGKLHRIPSKTVLGPSGTCREGGKLGLEITSHDNRDLETVPKIVVIYLHISPHLLTQLCMHNFANEYEYARGTEQAAEIKMD